MESTPGPRSYQGKQLLKTVLFAGGSLLVAAVFLFTYQSVSRLSHEVATTSELLASFSAQASIPAARNPALNQIFANLIDNIDFPIVITDTTGTPRAWHGVGVPSTLVPDATLDSLSLHLPVTPEHAERVHRIRDRVAGLDRIHKPLPMRQTGSNIVIGVLHYGEPALMNRLRWMPYLTMAGTGLLLLLGMGGLAGIRQAEKRTIWVGMAKETAHQLGTPLSSMVAWLELLKLKGLDQETVSEIEKDIQRLETITDRFSKIGSAARLERTDVVKVIDGMISYIRSRISARVNFILHPEPPAEIFIPLNTHLFEWVIENLLKNAVDAMEGNGTVNIDITEDVDHIHIDVSDTGKGIPKSRYRTIFNPGFTSKQRGWGLGLTLSRRIIENYHLGKIFVKSSAINKGTTFRIVLKK